MSIKQTITFDADVEKVYQLLTTASEFSAATGAAAEISSEEGGAFSCFDGQITGRNIELVPGARIVQAWRAGPWEDSVYSIVRFDLSQSGDQTTLSFTHTGYPEESKEHLEGGWQNMYWQPLKAHLA